MWMLAFGHHEDRTPTHGYAATCEAAMKALAPRAGIARNHRGGRGFFDCARTRMRLSAFGTRGAPVGTAHRESANGFDT
jgi:hypothetical protein